MIVLKVRWESNAGTSRLSGILSSGADLNVRTLAEEGGPTVNAQAAPHGSCPLITNTMPRAGSDGVEAGESHKNAEGTEAIRGI